MTTISRNPVHATLANSRAQYKIAAAAAAATAVQEKAKEGRKFRPTILQCPPNFDNETQNEENAYAESQHP